MWSRRKERLILIPERVVDTIEKLQKRIEERFGVCGLSVLCGQLLEIGRIDTLRALNIGRRYIWLRLLVFLILATAVVVFLSLLPGFDVSSSRRADAISLVEGLNAAADLTLMSGAAVIFLVRWEERLKRRRALAALHELRSIIHVIDMHQLTKDPSKFIIGSKTPSSPPLLLNETQMARYLDYCSEMLSLTSKVAMVFGQVLDDQIVTDVVSDIERISGGLSQKIWQKIVILQQLIPPAR
jgi:hypothetical protein